ncbi:MAG: hypothetical protein J5741_01855 [Bacteroidales bacterium]|nr:hypothetical protein [Bacteroidales bacterium]
MKKYFYLIAALILCQSMWAQNQIITTISPKVSLFPNTGLSYMDDPARYFAIQMVNTTGTAMDIFFTIELTAEFTATNQNYYVRTKKDFQPLTPLTVGAAPVLINRAIIDQVIGHLNATAYETNYDRNKLVQDLLSLPEGQYSFCITPYQWDGYNNPNPLQVGERTCFSFTICYTGSAPEFTSPISGLSAANLNNSNPSNNLLQPSIGRFRPVNNNPVNDPSLSNNLGDFNRGMFLAGSSDNRENLQYARLPLSRQLIFNWTGVISNCLNPNDFNYYFKIVEVTTNQNVQEAIDGNGTVTTFNNQSNTTYIYDTVVNRHFRLQPGHVYAAQVQAVLKKSLMTEIQLSNGGKSQIITFVWGDTGPIIMGEGDNSQLHSVISDNHDDIVGTLRNPYFVSPGQDKNTVDGLKAAFSTEGALVPVAGTNPYVTSVDAGDVPYYQVPVADTLGIRWMPVRGDSVLKVDYTAELYEYNGGAVANSMIGLPLKTYTTSVQQVHDFSPSATELMSVAGNEWVSSLQEGYKYLVHLKAETYYSYRKTTTYTITDYIHNVPVDRDSVVNTVAFGSQEMFSDVVFSWGVDSDALDQVYPPQFLYPQNLSTKQWDDTLMFEIPSVEKHSDFKFKWKAASGVDIQDTVYYKLLVAKLPKGKTPQQVKDTLFFKDSITTTSYMDTVLRDSLKTGEQYMAVLWAYVKQTENLSEHYNLINNGKSIYTTFKLVEPRAYNADLNNKYKCNPQALDNLSKDIITPSADSLVTNRVQLKMGDFPLVLQTATLDKDKKRYSGDGYIIWRPMDVDVRLKVKVDTIQINKDYQIINGTAVSTATDSSTYLSALMNDLNLDEWSEDDINRLAAQFGAEEEVKGYYDKFQEYGKKYGKKYGGLVGPLVGGNVATEVLTFPVSLTDKEFTGSKNVIFSINNMFFSPVTALMNMWAIFAAQEDDYYVPFVANNICMDQKSFFGKTDQHIDLFMARTYEKSINGGYTLRFKASSDFANPKDGTVITIDTGKFSSLRVEMEMDLNKNDFLGLNSEGLPMKGNVVKAKMTVELTSWSNWVAKASMDPFAVAGADRFTFYPTGKGIYYDHSDKQTPSEVSLTYDYLFGTPAPANMQDEDKKKVTKATKEWTGFYWDELKVFLSDEISNTFTDTVNHKDSMVVYHYGLNNTVTDSVHYNYPGSRINFGAKGLIIDKYGFTADFFAHDILSASTKEGWGWAFSLDTVVMKFTKNKYIHTLIKGGMGVPLFKGGFIYECSVGADSLTFNVQPRRDTMELDLWAAAVNFIKESSYFRVKKLYKESGTRVDLTLNGHISFKTSKIGLPSDFSFMKFERMGMRNYNLSGKPKEGTASIEKFEFDIGEWSFASPQKYIGGHSPEALANGKGGDGSLGSVDIGGFTFSLTHIDPIIETKGNDLKLGVTLAGKMKFVSGDCDFGASTGFAIWGVTEPKNKFHVKEVKGRLDSIRLDKIDFMIFKMSGVLNFTYECPTCTKVTGFKGNLKVTVMEVVDLTMSAGFGKQKDNKGEFTWWFFDGACKFPGGIPLGGVVSINGFSGGFAYNMKARDKLSDPKYSAKGLLEVANKNDDKETLQRSGMDYDPSRGSWVANAGISLILTGAQNTMNADGLVSVRIDKQHFSGIFIEANAYMVSVMNGNTPGDGSNNPKALIKAKTILGFENLPQYYYLRFSLCVKAKLSLQDLLNGVSSSKLDNLKDKITGAIHEGLSIATNPNIATTLENMMDKGDTDLSSHTESERATAANASGSGSSNIPNIGASTEVQIPFDFELKTYKKAYDGHKKGETDWYLALGKPQYEERLLIKQTLDMIVVKTMSEFTFYMQTGNAFAYELPPLSKDLQDFFGIANDEKKLDANKEQVSNSRRISNTDWLKIDKAGGFCLGATFHSSMELNFFLYVDIDADLGFDVALLDVNGLGCPGYPNIGQNNFYALGRIYAALRGDVGLKVNLGFWKGKFSLFSAGIGALLQGGGPNPSYCYGMLRFKVNLLNGLVKFSTSCDFHLGDVCVPGVGDPLANVKLFENVTPGFETEKMAEDKANLQSPLQIGTIVSNMPWNREVFLADNDGSNARRFRFQLMTNSCKYATKSSSRGSYANVTGNQMLKYTYSDKDANVMLFESMEGGLVPAAYNRLMLKARAFEYRTKLTGKDLGKIENDKKKDVMYNVTTGAVQKENPRDNEYGWFDPIFFNDKTNRNDVRPYIKDTTLYFKTNAMDTTLRNQIVFSWPYNGETHFPAKEYVHSAGSSNSSGLLYNQYHSTNSDPIPYCNLYLYKQRNDLLNRSILASNGKELKIYLLKAGLEDGELAECSYSYYNTTTVPYLSVQLPTKEYGLPSGFGAHMLKFILVDKDAYDNALAAAMQAADITIKQAEYSSRISDQTYSLAEQAHNQASGRGRRGNTNSNSGGGGGRVVIPPSGSGGFSTGSGGSGGGSSSGGNHIVVGSVSGYSMQLASSSGSGSNSSNSGGNNIKAPKLTTTGTVSNTTTITTLNGAALQGLASTGSSSNMLSGTVITTGGSSGGSTATTSSSSGRIVRGTTSSNTTGSGGSTSSSGRRVGGSSNSASLTYTSNRRTSNGRLTGSSNQSSSPNMTLASSQLNIQNEMLDEIYMEMQEDGKDSMTYIRTRLKEGYKISCSIGTEIYQWTWYVDPYYNTYQEMLLDKFGQNFNNFSASLQRCAVSDQGSYIKVTNPGLSYDPMGTVGFLFISYDPADPNRYNTSCVMPPICYFTIKNTTDNKLVSAHKRNFQYLIDLENDFKKTELATVFHSYKDDDKIKYSKDGSNLMDANTAAQYRKIIKNGLILSSNGANDFLSINHRIKGSTAFTQCVAANYHPNSWDLPCILETYVTSGQKREPLQDLFFKAQYAGAAPSYLANSRDRWSWYIKDYATVAMVDDIKKIRGFMEDMQRHAKALDGRGWSYKRDIVNRFSNSSHINSFMTYTAFPYDMPEIYRVNHFVKALDNVVNYTRNNLSYLTTSGTYCRFYNHDEDFIPADELQLQDRYWAKYWWHTYAQCLDLEHHGFDRTFYTEDKAKYYNTMQPLNAGGKHNLHDTYSAILGAWYQNDPDIVYLYNNYIYNHVSIFYLTSQNTGFTDNLMKIADAIKKSNVQNDLIFFPNAQMTSPVLSTFYTVDIYKMSRSFQNKFASGLKSTINKNSLSND